MTLKLPPDEIHLWHADGEALRSDPLLVFAQGWLDPVEQRRFARYHLTRHRQRYLLGRALIRKTLSRYVESDPALWRLTESRHGKPRLAGGQTDTPLYFNLSHSGSTFVLALARHELVGVDIEQGDRSRRVERIAGRYFAPLEVQQLLALEHSARLGRFYTLWTLKEAYIKARGLGLALPLQDFSFSFPAADHIALGFRADFADRPEDWQFWHWQPQGKLHLALAVKAPEPALAIRHWRLNSLADAEPMTLRVARRKLPGQGGT